MMHCQCVVTLLLLANFLQTKEIEATVKLTATPIRLSETTTATLTIVGPAPLLVNLPSEPLSEESQAIWRATTVGTVSTTKLSDGQERWQLSYRVEPFVPGDAIALQFQSIEVDNETIEIPKVSITVTTDAKAAIANLRPWTDIETVPPLPPSVPMYRRWWWLPIALLALVLLAVRVFRRSDKPLSMIAMLRQRFVTLEQNAETLPTDHFADELHGIVRDFIADHANLDAEHLTTPELIQTVDVDERFSSESGNAIREVLQQCETLRFAPPPTSDNRLSLLTLVGSILHSQTVSPAPTP